MMEFFMARTISRRHLTASSLSAMALAYAGRHATQHSAMAQTDGTPEAGPGDDEIMVGEAVAPSWRFAVSTFEDPYQGTISTPSSSPPETRFIGAEVIITNDSEQPLEFRVGEIRLADSRGFLYPAGGVIGSEPRLVSQNLPNHERTRGWVWFMVSNDAEPTQIAFDGPAPSFRVELPAAS
jgi:hypothetical protein